MVTDSVTKSQALSFSGRLRDRARERRSWLCVGLDPDIDRLPSALNPSPSGVVEFCRSLIQATCQYAVAFKINFAFFEALGPDGWRALQEVREAVPTGVPVIADAKRGDIGSTSRAYAKGIFEVLGFDAVTVSPYVGWDGLEPFLAYGGKGVFVLCRTSNPGSSALQALEINGQPLYMRIAREALQLPGPADVGLVIGATALDAAAEVRGISQDVLLLLPGVGAQGAAARETVSVAANRRGDNALLPVSRQIMYASSGEDYAKRAADAAQELAAATWLDIHASDR